MSESEQSPDQSSVLDALIELERAESRLLAQRLRLLADFDTACTAEARRQGVEQFGTLELAGSCRLGQQSAEVRRHDAAHATEQLPLAVAALDAGELFVPQARVVITETKPCAPEVCAAVDAVVAERGQCLPPARLRKLVRRTILQAEAVDRQAEADRLAAARASRRVWIRPEPDGMTMVGALMSAEVARAFMLGLDALAREMRAGSDRTMDQCRADALAELPLRALGKSAGARVVINVHVPVATVLDRSSSPGHLDGYGPISAQHVRLLLPSADLRRVLVDEGTGQPVAVDSRTCPADDAPRLSPRRLHQLLRPTAMWDRVEDGYRPSAALDRFVRLRDQTCSGPGCSQPAAACDLDHLIPHPTGPTAAWNLLTESRRCHRAKHSGWTVLRHLDGSVTWVSPLGRRYRRPPPWDPPPAVGPQTTPARPTDTGEWEEPRSLEPLVPDVPPPPPPPLPDEAPF